jgi:hypothetical protein
VDGHDCQASTCPVCLACLECYPHLPGEFRPAKTRWSPPGRVVLAGPCRDAMVLRQLDDLERMEADIRLVLSAPGISPRTRVQAEGLARQLAADRDSLLGTGHL